jgi:hypothetical protein
VRDGGRGIGLARVSWEQVFLWADCWMVGIGSLRWRRAGERVCEERPATVRILDVSAGEEIRVVF